VWAKERAALGLDSKSSIKMCRILG